MTLQAAAVAKLKAQCRRLAELDAVIALLEQEVAADRQRRWVGSKPGPEPQGCGESTALLRLRVQPTSAPCPGQLALMPQAPAPAPCSAQAQLDRPLAALPAAPPNDPAGDAMRRFAAQLSSDLRQIGLTSEHIRWMRQFSRHL